MNHGIRIPKQQLFRAENAYYGQQLERINFSPSECPPLLLSAPGRSWSFLSALVPCCAPRAARSLALRLTSRGEGLWQPKRRGSPGAGRPRDASVPRQRCLRKLSRCPPPSPQPISGVRHPLPRAGRALAGSTAAAAALGRRLGAGGRAPQDRKQPLQVAAPSQVAPFCIEPRSERSAGCTSTAVAHTCPWRRTKPSRCVPGAARVTARLRGGAVPGVLCRSALLSCAGDAP